MARYWAFKDQVKLLDVKLETGDGITFIMPMPKSWSKKRRRDMQWKAHIQTPDLDNLLKAIFDSVHKQDSHIWWLSGLRKVWGLCGWILIEEMNQATMAGWTPPKKEEEKP